MASLKYKDKNGQWKNIMQIKGETGAPGVTPVKGEDYYTEEEQNEIAERVAIETLTSISQQLEDVLGDIPTPSVQGYIDKTNNLRNDLADNLTTKGVVATHEEKLDMLVPKVLDIVGGDTNINDFSYMFYQGARKNEIAKIVSLGKDVTSVSNMCASNSSGVLFNNAFNNLDYSKVTNASNMFSTWQGHTATGTTNTFRPNFSSALKNFSSAFRTCNYLDIDFSNCDFSGLTDISNLFSRYPSQKNITLLDLTTFTPTQKLSYYYFCEGATFANQEGIEEIRFNPDIKLKASSLEKCFATRVSLKKCNIEQIDTSECTNIANAFEYNYAITNTNNTDYNINNVDVTNVTSFSYTFRNCTGLEVADLSKWNPIKTSLNVSGLFSNCSKLTKIDMRNFEFTNATSYSSMLSSVPTTVEIIVKDDANKQWFNNKFSSYTNVKTVDELAE